MRLLARLGRVWTVAAALAVVAPAVAGAQEASGSDSGSNDQEARVHFRLGKAYYESGRFEDAAKEFQQAYEFSQRAQLLYNVFLAWRDAGRLDKAVEALESYLAKVPEAPERDALKARLASMKRLLEKQGPGAVTAEEPSGEQQGQTGEAETEGEGEGAAVEGGPATTSAAPEEAEPEHHRSPVPWIVMGAGGAMVIAGVATGIMALNQEKDLEGACGPDGTSCPAGFESDASRGKTLALTTDILLFTGVAAAGVGVALLFLLDRGGSDEEPPPAETPTASVGCSAHGCMGTVRLRF